MDLKTTMTMTNHDATATMTQNNASSASAMGRLSAAQVDKRRDFTRKQTLRRQVYRDVTVFQTFPLQAMAMDNCDEQLTGYFGADPRDGASDADKDSDGDDAEASGAKASVSRREARSSAECDPLRQQYRREFLEENSLRVPAAAAGVGATSKPSLEGTRQGGQSDASAQDEKNSSAPDNGGETPSDNKENKPQTSSIANPRTRHPHAGGDHPGEQQRPTLSNEETQRTPSSDGKKGQGGHFGSTLWSMEPRIFAMETAIKGKRRYLR